MSTTEEKPQSQSRSLKSTIGVIGALATAVAAILGLIFLLDPGLKPHAPSDTLGGTITQVTWRQAVNGQVGFDVRVNLAGFNGKPCRLGYSVYNGQGAYIGEANPDAVDFTPERDNDTGAATVMVPQPATAGTYYVVFTLFDPKGSGLDSKQSIEFTVS